MKNTQQLAISMGALAILGSMAACGMAQRAPNAAPETRAAAMGPARPNLPSTLFAYADASAPLPLHYVRGGPPGRGGGPPGRGGPNPPPPRGGGPGGRGGRGASVISADRAPAANPTSDAGATLGRVLFYDVRLSANNTIACASCHQQQFGFSDTARLSVGLHGERTARHAMSLANARFYQSGRYFWDERASTLESQVLQPIQNNVEMGMTLDSLVPKLQKTPYYPALFTAAFGSADVSSDKISRALAQFVRSLVSADSRFDQAFARNQPPPDFSVLTPQQQQGQRLFAGRAGCQGCHGTNAQILDAARNNGLDSQTVDAGAGQGRFKSPSLRNVAVRAPYMHDGRFKTLREVVDFYDHGVQPNRDLDRRMRTPNGAPRKLNLTSNERDALVAYLESLTDSAFLKAEKFSDPFARSRTLR